MLNIFHTGGVTEGLTIFWLGLCIWLGYQSVKAHKSPMIRQDQQTGKNVEIAKKTPYYVIPQFWGVVGLTIAYIVVLVVFVAPDYKGV